ncbi:T9SS type A sorting domain-containing protein [Fluviicola sp.]|uniref:T9SS type A sorting domain-containing protein n=1 Tax=Fluviicola sp. TaxID=1917219 RepID=UPI0031CF06FA
MKRIYLFTCIFLVSSLNAQVDIKLWDHQVQATTGNTINGTEQVVAVSSDGDYSLTFNFKYTSGTSKEWKVERLRLTDTPAWEDRLNWGVAGDPAQEQGYSPGQMNSNPWTVIWSYQADSGNSLNLTAIASVQGAGEELYRYYLVENGTRIDSVDYRVTTALGVGTNEPESAIAVFPNPASGLLTIQATGSSEVSYAFKMLDAHGRVVLESRELQQIDLGTIENGLYTVLISKDQKPVQVTRVAVMH